MTVSFNPLKANGHTFSGVPELDDLEVSLSNDNARDVLQALGVPSREWLKVEGGVISGL